METDSPKVSILKDRRDYVGWARQIRATLVAKGWLGLGLGHKVFIDQYEVRDDSDLLDLCSD